MKTLIVDKKFNQKKLTRYLCNQFPNLAISNIYKALRKKDILVNGKRISNDVVLNEKDNIIVYISDDLLYKKAINLDIVYEDDNLLIVNKPAGINVTSDEKGESTLSELVKEYMFSAIPCHRIDRNTTGIVLYAKNEDTLAFLLEKFELREIEKHYLCITVGIPKDKQKTLNSFLFKDNKKSHVYVSDTLKQGYLPIVTKYKVLKENVEKNIALLEVLIETGRTHQIRAHLAHIDYPILGDGKYGINQINKSFKVAKQLLCAYSLKFVFKQVPKRFEYLNGMKFEVNTGHIVKYMEEVKF